MYNIYLVCSHKERAPPSPPASTATGIIWKRIFFMGQTNERNKIKKKTIHENGLKDASVWWALSWINEDLCGKCTQYTWISVLIIIICTESFYG